MEKTLKGQEVSLTQSEFEQALQVFNTFKCRSLKDYHDVYLTVDTLQLACVFAHFRRTLHKFYGLDAVQYFPASHLSGDAYLKLCDARIELITNREHLGMVQNLKRGGLESVFPYRFFESTLNLWITMMEQSPQHLDLWLTPLFNMGASWRKISFLCQNSKSWTPLISIVCCPHGRIKMLVTY